MHSCAGSTAVLARCRDRLQQARRDRRAGLRAGRVPRLLDLARGRGRDGAPRERRHRTRVGRRRYTYKRPCWFRYFWEREPSARVYEPRDLLDLCKGEEGMQRAGCISGASLLVSRERDPVDHARVCNGLQRSDTYDCLRGVNVSALADRIFEQLRLIRTCGDLPHDHPRVVLSLVRPHARRPHRRRFPHERLPAARGRERPRALREGRQAHRPRAAYVLVAQSSAFPQARSLLAETASSQESLKAVASRPRRATRAYCSGVRASCKPQQREPRKHEQ